MTGLPLHVNTWNSAGRDKVRDLIQQIFIKEFRRPSKELWLISPWLSNIPVIDDRASQWRSLTGPLAGREIRLFQALEYLLKRGTRMVFATRNVPENRDALKRIDILRQGPFADQVTPYEREDLHIKGLLTDHLLLSGSMNITFRGIGVNEERVTLTSKLSLGSDRIEFRGQYPHGGTSHVGR